jgi:hypothetical protein
MGNACPVNVIIPLDRNQAVSGLLLVPDRARACFVLAHGAGAGMSHPFMEAVARGLAERGIATLRYQFPYMEKGGRRPDPPSLAQATVRTAVAEASKRMPSLPMFAGGKSFGGRMTSQAQAASALPDVAGLAFLGFPLHPAGKPSPARGEHLSNVQVPMLFVQGSRDALADAVLIRRVAKALGVRGSLAMICDADHSFHLPVRSGRTDDQARAEMLDLLVRWFDRVAADRTPSREQPAIATVPSAGIYHSPVASRAKS